MNRYKSPDDRSTASLVAGIAFHVVWVAMMVVAALRKDPALTVFFATLIVTDHLTDIHRELRATRQLTEQSTRLAKSWKWSA